MMNDECGMMNAYTPNGLSRLGRMILVCSLVCSLTGIKISAQEASEAEKKVEKKLQKLYGDSRKKKPLAKPKAGKKHDRVTFIIKEKIYAKHEATTDVERESKMKWELNKWFTIKFDKDGNLVAIPRIQTTNDNDTSGKSGTQKPEVDFKATRAHKGEGEVERKSDITDEISGEVMDVLPNGHLVVQARKSLKIDGEETTVTLTGRVDPKDLTADSKVDSKLVMDMRIKFAGKGSIRDMQKRGWGAKILDKLNPF